MVTGISSNIAAKNDDGAPNAIKSPSGIPGRLFVIPFVLVLTILGVLMFSVAVRFQSIMARLEEARSLWPNGSQELETRYDSIKDSLIHSGASETVRNEWDVARQEFNLSSLFDRQSIASVALERQIFKTRTASERNSSDFDLPGISKLIEAESRRKKSQEDMIGWLTVQGLRLKLPPIYDPRTNEQ